LFWLRVFSYFRGCLVLKLQGNDLERLINLSVREGVGFWDVKQSTPWVLSAKIAAGDLNRLRKVIKKTGCRGKVVARLGWPFFWRSLVKRRWWMGGLVLFFFTLYFFSSFVWLIRIEGTELLSPTQIISDLHTLGLHPGVPKGEIEEKRDWLIEELKVRYPQTLFVTMDLNGVVAQVKVVEKTLAPPVKDEVRQLYAAKDGLVTDVVVIEGTPQIKEGDMVVRGDLLIMGKKALRRLDGTVESSEVNAVGIVKARVWYEAYVEEPLTYWSARLVQGKKTVYGIRVNNQWFPFFSWGKATGRVIRSRERFEVYKGRNRLSLVEIIKDTYQQVTWEKQRITPEQALYKARKEGNDKLLFQLPAAVKPEKLQEEWEVKNGFLTYRLVGETLEDIAVDFLKEEKP